MHGEVVVVDADVGVVFLEKPIVGPCETSIADEKVNRERDELPMHNVVVIRLTSQE